MSTPGMGAMMYHGIGPESEERERRNIERMTMDSAENPITEVNVEQRIDEYQRSRRCPVVCICGSMKFFPEMLRAAHQLTLEENIVLMPLVRKAGDLDPSELKAQKETEQALPDGVNLHVFLDAMHRDKIDMAERVVVVTDKQNYIGSSTKAEIAYAISLGKDISFLKYPVAAVRVKGES